MAAHATSSTEDLAEGARGGSGSPRSRASSYADNDGDLSSRTMIEMDSATNARKDSMASATEDALNKGDEGEVEDVLMEGNSIFRPRTLYLNNLSLFDVGRMPTHKLLGEIQKTVRFEKGSRVRNSLKIIFFDEDTAKFAVETPIPFFGKDAHLQRPRGFGGVTPEFITKTLHIYGLPFEVSMKALGDYLKECGMEPLFAGRFIKWKDTDIDSPGRSFVVRVAGNFEIPPTMRWPYKKHVKGFFTLRFWFPGMPAYCRSCFEYGHASNECTKWPKLASRRDSNAGNTGMAARHHHQYYNDPEYGKLCAWVKELIEGAGDLPEVDLSGVDMEIIDEQFKCNDFAYWKQFSSKKRQKVEPFNVEGDLVKTCFNYGHPDNYFASNFYADKNCPIKIWGSEYSSSEKFLAVKKSQWMKDPLLDEILAEEDPYRLKRLHGRVMWKGGLKSWTIFAFELLGIANEAKFRQNQELRKRLFGLAGLLVESDTGKNQWCCGLKRTDNDLSDRNRWPAGCWNLNGDLLTLVRSNLTRSEEFAEEFKEIFQETLQKYRNDKRDRENRSPPIPAKRNK